MQTRGNSHDRHRPHRPAMVRTAQHHRGERPRMQCARSGSVCIRFAAGSGEPPPGRPHNRHRRHRPCRLHCRELGTLAGHARNAVRPATTARRRRRPLAHPRRNSQPCRHCHIPCATHSRRRPPNPPPHWQRLPRQPPPRSGDYKQLKRSSSRHRRTAARRQNRKNRPADNRLLGRRTRHRPRTS